MVTPGVREFDAFISYSRRASAVLAADLQSGVERFAKPVFRLRALRVFRDDASMAANPALWSSIERGLQEAGWFVLLASPAAAASEYVAQEVRWWREHKSADRVLIVLEEGVDIVWDRAAGDFDLSRTDSLPPALAGAFAEEPRWIDLRWYELEGSLRQADPRWPERVADIAAAVRGVERDQLIGENVRAHRRLVRLRRAVIAGLSVLTVLALVAAVVAINQRGEARRQTKVAVAQRERATAQARIALGRQLAAEALQLAPTDIRTASLLAVQAYRISQDTQTRAALFQLATASPHLVRTLPVGAEVTASAVTPTGEVVTGDADGRVQTWDGTRATTAMTLDAAITSVSVSDDGSVLAAVASDAGEAQIETAGGIFRPSDAINPVTVAVAPAGDRMAISGAGDTGQGTEVYRLDPAGPAFLGRADAEVDQIGFGPSGLVGFSYSTARWVLVDPDTGTILDRGHTRPGGMGAGVAVSADGTTLAQLSNGTDQRVWTSTASLHGAPDRGDLVAHGTAVAITGSLSADGGLLALEGTAGLEVATVQDPRRPAAPPVALTGGATDLTASNYHALSFGGDRFLASAQGATAYVWDLDQTTRLGTQWPEQVPVGCYACRRPRVSVSPDGTRALVTSPDGNGTAIVDLADGRATRVGGSQGNGLYAASWADDQHLIALRDGGLVAVDVRDGSETALPAPGLSTTSSLGDSAPVAVEADGLDDPHAVVVWDEGAIDAVDLAAGRVVGHVQVPGHVPYVWDAGIAPGGGSAWVLRAQAASSDYSVTAVALPSGEVRWRRNGRGAGYDDRGRMHVFGLTSVATVPDRGAATRTPAEVATDPLAALSPDAGLVASGGSAGEITLLDLTERGSPFGSITVPQQDNRTAVSAFTPDGRSLVTAIEPTHQAAYPHGSLLVTSLRPADWITAACAVAGRDLTAADWARYGSGPVPGDLRCAA